MIVYAHFVYFIISMFPCIQNLSIKWIKSNIIVFFHVLTLILSKSQSQFKLTLAVGGYRVFFLSKNVIISITLVYFIVINGLIHEYYEKELFQTYFIGINFL